MMRYRTLLIAGAALFWTAAVFAQLPAKDVKSALPWLKFENLTATRERPLFAPNRRPPVVSGSDMPEEEVISQTPSEPAFALKGIIAQPLETLILLEDITASRSVIVRSGETYGRWRVVAEGLTSVHLAAGTEQIRLELFPH